MLAREFRFVMVVMLACAAAMLPACASSVPPVPARSGGWQTIGASLQGRVIEATTVGRSGPRVLVVGSIHGNETEALGAVDALRAHVLVFEADRAVVRIVRDVNPDGSAVGARGNGRGVDLNRNWPASNFEPSPRHGAAALSEPESRVLWHEIGAFEPDVVVVCHSIARGPFVNYDGPAAELAAAFARAAARFDPRWRVEPDMGYATPGSMGSFLGRDRGIAILTVEFERGHDERSALHSLCAGLSAVIGSLLGQGDLHAR